MSYLRSRSADAPARRLARRFAQPGARVLDVGAGSARWSLPFAAEPGTHVTALDLPEQAAALRAALTQTRAAHQYTVLEGDVFMTPPDALGTYNVVIAANIFHLFPPSRALELARRLATLVKPGGALVIVDQVLELTPDWPRWSALYAVGATLGAPGGFLYPPATYAHWLTASALSDVRASPVCPLPPLTAITAQRERTPREAPRTALIPRCSDTRSFG